ALCPECAGEAVWPRGGPPPRSNEDVGGRPVARSARPAQPAGDDARRHLPRLLLGSRRAASAPAHPDGGEPRSDQYLGPPPGVSAAGRVVVMADRLARDRESDVPSVDSQLR